jgi:hypothetical protein
MQAQKILFLKEPEALEEHAAELFAACSPVQRRDLFYEVARPCYAIVSGDYPFTAIRHLNDYIARHNALLRGAASGGVTFAMYVDTLVHTISYHPGGGQPRKDSRRYPRAYVVRFIHNACHWAPQRGEVALPLLISAFGRFAEWGAVKAAAAMLDAMPRTRQTYADVITALPVEHWWFCEFLSLVGAAFLPTGSSHRVEFTDMIQSISASDFVLMTVYRVDGLRSKTPVNTYHTSVDEALDALDDDMFHEEYGWGGEERIEAEYTAEYEPSTVTVALSPHMCAAIVEHREEARREELSEDSILE